MGIGNIHRDAPHPEVVIARKQCAEIIEPRITRAVALVKRPLGLRVKDQGNLGRGICPVYLGCQRFQQLSDLRHLAEGAGIAGAGMGNDGRMEFLCAAAALADLEIHGRIRTVRNGIDGRK